MPVRSTKTFIRVALLGLVGLLLWANWQAPYLHQYAPATAWTVLRIESPAAAQPARLAQLPGVVACSLSPDGRTVVLSYHPDQTTLPRLQAASAADGCRLVAAPMPAPAPASAAPQCPVPYGYVAAIERLRFVLNVRRFFYKV